MLFISYFGSKQSTKNKNRFINKPNEPRSEYDKRSIHECNKFILKIMRKENSIYK